MIPATVARQSEQGLRGSCCLAGRLLPLHGTAPMQQLAAFPAKIGAAVVAEWPYRLHRHLYIHHLPLRISALSLIHFVQMGKLLRREGQERGERHCSFSNCCLQVKAQCLTMHVRWQPS